MPIPALTDQGLLPPGVHFCTLEEVGERFGRFGMTNQRRELFARFEDFVDDVRLTGMAHSIVIDGSFVTAADHPGDIDVILVMAETHDFGAELRPFQYNVLSRRRVRRRFGFDLLVAGANSPQLVEFVAFFQQVRGRADVAKGILEIDL